MLRRRIRFLRRRRELALHDLGGFVFETHRLGESRPELTAQKLADVDAIDGELATLERALALGEELIVLHEPGISACIQLLDDPRQRRALLPGLRAPDVRLGRVSAGAVGGAASRAAGRSRRASAGACAAAPAPGR